LDFIKLLKFKLLNCIISIMKMNYLATLGGLIMISSVFLPWITSDSWWLNQNGSLVDLTEKGFSDFGSYHLNDFGKKELYQVFGIMMCLVYLIIGGLLTLPQVKWMAKFGTGLSISGLLIYTLLTLNFLSDIKFNEIEFGYYMGWVGTILLGISTE
jgi:hypothetical protein